jgi:hypothetical protein
VVGRNRVGSALVKMGRDVGRVDGMIVGRDDGDTDETDRVGAKVAFCPPVARHSA